MEIRDFINKESILLNVAVENSEQVIRLLGKKLQDQGYVKDNFISAALEREKNMPTGLPLNGDINASIPHVDIEYVNKSHLGLAVLQNEVVFYNMVDHQQQVPCKLVIMLALDEPKSQIAMLKQIATLLQSPERVNRIVSATTREEVLAALDE